MAYWRITTSSTWVIDNFDYKGSEDEKLQRMAQRRQQQQLIGGEKTRKTVGEFAAKIRWTNFLRRCCIGWKIT